MPRFAISTTHRVGSRPTPEWFAIILGATGTVIGTAVYILLGMLLGLG